MAWNAGVVGAIPRTNNPLFEEMRARLRPIETPESFAMARAAVDYLRRLVPAGTTSRDHLDMAAAFLVEVQELYLVAINDKNGGGAPTLG